jgi:hypothetical protein
MLYIVALYEENIGPGPLIYEGGLIALRGKLFVSFSEKFPTR